MQVGNASSRPPRRERLEDATERWAVPLGHVAGTRVNLSYTVFFAAAIVVAVVLTLAGKSDLPRTAAMGVAFWISGWLVQVVTHFGLTWLLRLRTTRLTVGLFGLEAVPRFWSAPKSLIVSLGTVVSLLLLGLLFRMIEGGFQMPVLSRAPSDIWIAPSIGFASYDSVWRSAAWLCWVQCLFQMYPLPRTMGRQTLAALASICGRGLNLTSQSLILRRCLSVVAGLTVVLAIISMSGETQVFVVKWPLILLLGILLWLSSRASDVTAILAGFQSRGEDPYTAPELRIDQAQTSRPGPVSSIRRSLRTRHERRGVKLAMKKERNEATDAARLDEILNRVHCDGIDSLSREDREILDRVSENLRKQRQTESPPSEDSR
jgi:hypothetical protein